MKLHHYCGAMLLLFGVSGAAPATELVFRYAFGTSC